MNNERNTEAESAADPAGRLEAIVRLPIHKCCASHGRDWRETQRGLLPPSEHSPGCLNFRLERFAAITYQTGALCIEEWPGETECADLAIEDDHSTLGEIWMTRDQFDRLNEFAGP